MQPGSFQISLKVFLRRDDRFLVLRDAASGLGDLPGGRIGHAEFYGDWSAAIEREMLEELGPALRYVLDPNPALIFPHRIVSANTDGLGVAYQARHTEGAVELSSEHDGFEWVSLTDYDPGSFFHPHLADAVRRLQRLVQEQRG